MFGKQKVSKTIPVKVEAEPTVDLEVEAETKEKVTEKIEPAKDKIEKMEKELAEAKASVKEKPEENLMTVSAVELIGQGIFKYTLISNKPIWEIGMVLKL